jgi:hypothetical protein
MHQIEPEENMDSTIALLSEDQATLVYNALSFGTAVVAENPRNQG